MARFKRSAVAGTQLHQAYTKKVKATRSKLVEGYNVLLMLALRATTFCAVPAHSWPIVVAALARATRLRRHASAAGARGMGVAAPGGRRLETKHQIASAPHCPLPAPQSCIIKQPP